jgi:hypothetical protein
LLTWIAAVAVAQEPPPEEPSAGVFNADKVLVATFEAEGDAGPDAERLQAALLERLSASNAVVTMAEVPDFERHGYGGVQYMRSCPPGEYAGCALVVGQRVEADRVVGAVVRREPDAIEDDKTVLMMTIHMVDVHDAREVASFGLLVPPDREADTIDGIANVFDDVVRGDYALRDLRERGPSDEEEELARARAERVAESLSTLEEDLGTAIRAEAVGWIRPRLTRDDLVALQDREEAPPWIRVGMSEDEYLRFVNSGEDLVAWRQSGWGRFGRVLLRATVSGGNGPWHQAYEGKVLLSDQDLQPVQSVQYLEVVNAASGGMEFEAGFGVAPFVDLTLVAAIRTGATTYVVDDDVQGQVSLPSREQRIAMSTWQFGVRTQLAPFPRWRARPTVGVGIARWSGAGIPASTRFERLPPPNAVFLEVLPGVEVDASDQVALSLRLLESVPIGGDLVRTTESGEPLLAEPPGPSNQRGPGIGIQAGVLVRLGPLFERPPPKLGGFDDDEP